MIMMMKSVFFLLLGMLINIHAGSAPKPSPDIKHVAVFCSADDKVSDTFKKSASSLGEELAKAGFSLVTGGSKTGLMKAVTNGYLKAHNNETLYAVMPEVMRDLNVHHTAIKPENFTWTPTLEDRLQEFYKLTDAVIILPGGFGTLHELMSFLVQNQFGLANKMLIILNINGFWDNLLQQFKKMVAESALKQKHLDILKVVSSTAECLELLKMSDQSPKNGFYDRYWEKDSPPKKDAEKK